MRARLHILCVLIFIFICKVSADEYYPRHYIILVDQTRDLQVDDNATFKKVYSYIKANLTGVGDSSFVFNEVTDEISLYTFALPGAYVHDWYGGKFIGAYGKIHSFASHGQSSAAYKVFVEELIQNNSKFSAAREKGQPLEDFLDKNLYPLFVGKSSHYVEIEKLSVPTAVTFSKYIYPVILEREHFDFTIPASEYIIIIASNFQSGLDDIGTSQDRNTLIDMIGERGSMSKPTLEFFEQRFKTLSDPFYQIPVFKKEFISSIPNKNALPTALGYKLGLQSLQGVSTYITSNIDIQQKGFESPQYKIGVTNVAFNHDNNLVIDSVKLKVFEDKSQKELYNCIISEGELSNGNYKKNVVPRSYDFGERVITLENRKIGDNLQFKYLFYATIKNGNQIILPMVFVADRNVVLTESVFYPEFTLFEKMALIFVLFVFIASAIFAWMAYNKRGKLVLRGVHVKIWHVSNSRFMELKDYHVVDRDCWYMRQGETQRMINITGNVDIQKKSLARPYQLKVEYKIDDVDSNEDFSFRPEGHENNGENKRKATWYEVPLNSDGSFEINAIAFQVAGSTPDLENRYNILDMKVTVKARLLLNGKDVVQPKEDEQYYQFIVRPEIANAALWMAFDPGTSGACVAYGIGGNPTDQTNIKIAYNTEKDSSGQEKQVSIFPSKIKIPDNSSLITNVGDVNITALKEAREYGAEGDFYFGNLAGVYEGRNSFQSIKKLLGYNDTHPLLDEQRHEICRLPGRDLALLLVKGLCNHFESYIRTSSDVTDKERSLFIQNGSFAPSRAIVAVPNNYTIVKAQDMVDSVKRTELFKEVHYLYEAEAVMMCYLRNKWDDITSNPSIYAEEGRFFVVFDMGGATINTTAFTINVITAENRDNRYIREIELSTKARVGYNVGGDDIDYAWIRILYQIPAVVKYFKENNIDNEEHIKKHRTGILKFVQKLKLDWMARLAQDEPLTDEDIDLLWLDISSDNGLPELGIDLQNEIDEESAEFLRDEWSSRSVIKKYVFSAVENAVAELLSTEHAHSVEIIFSGRTSLYPGIRQTVTETVATMAKKQPELKDYSVWDGFEKANTGKSIDEVVKTAVATGACWYAMFSKFIKLKHNIVTSTFGYVDMEDGRSTFIPLIQRGTKLDEHGNMTSNPDYRVLTPNLPNVRILQMLTTKYEYVMNGLSSANRADNDKVKHLVNQLAHLTSEEVYGEIKSIAISVDDKNNFSYKVKMAGGQPLTGSGTVNDADIKTENSDAYAFSAMPCSEDETEDTPVKSESDQYASDKPTSSHQEQVLGDENFTSAKHKKSNSKKHF